MAKKSAAYRLKRRAIGMISPRWRAVARDVVKLGVGEALSKAVTKNKRMARIERGDEICKGIASRYVDDREQLLKDFPL